MKKNSTIQKIARIAVVAAAVGGLFAFGACSKKANNDAAGGDAPSAAPTAAEKYGSDTLKLYLPGAYTSDDLIPNFQKQFGVRVIVENFDSNEMMYAKVQAGDKYDVLIPSDYMIERLLKQNMLQKLDRSMIPNASELTDAVLNLSYDPKNEYSMPYFWGNVGIVYNTEKVDPEDIKAGYEIFQNEKYAGKIYWYDSERDSFMIALKVLGYSMNTDNKDEINKAYEWLLKMHDTVKPTYVTDEVIDNMSNGLRDIAIVYSGDAATILKANKKMSYIAPEQGTNIWVDAMVIPANAENPKLANEFINYALSYEAALGNTQAVGYASANAKVLDEMTKEGGEYATNAAYRPRAGFAKDEIFHDNDVIRKMISELWIKGKAH
ncbi:MAG: ABC transporter substrate-binding protein [Proteobacteria bacterium]|nr:ABC transporter substrate-binding protein [Pseudomonadota bacterium]